MRRLAALLPLALVTVMLVGCVAQPPPPPPPQVVLPRPPPPPPPPAPEPHREAPEPARWSFSIANGICTATLADPAARLRIAAGPGASLALTASGAPRLRHVSFSSASSRGSPGSGDAESWAFGLRPVGADSARATAALDEAAQGWLQALLSGGTLRLEAAEGEPIEMTVPDAGISGRDWFGCVAQHAPDEPAAEAVAPGIPALPVAAGAPAEANDAARPTSP